MSITRRNQDILDINLEGISFVVLKEIIDWFDPPMCDRAMQIIPKLLRSINDIQATITQYHAEATNAEYHLEATNAEYRREARRMKILLWLSWLGFVAMNVVCVVANVDSNL
ncbi:hypothetical protein Tco_1257216 [Tanacetum coccineum]